MAFGRAGRSLVVVGLVAAALACRQAEPVVGTVAPPDVNGPPADATVTSTGLAFRVLARGGHGRHPTPESRVLVNYTGWTTDGRIVDGVPVGTEPVALRVSETMPGWQEGLRMMVEGDKYRFWIPPALAHRHDPAKPPGMLVYDITLVRIVD
jgi:peptidylprolyl isomerase